MKIKPLEWAGPRWSAYSAKTPFGEIGGVLLCREGEVVSATLPYDNARCAGHGLIEHGGKLAIFEECRDCLRRTEPAGDWQPWNNAPDFDGRCPDKITKESRPA